MIVDTIELYMLILVLLTLTLTQDHRRAREQNYLTKFSVDLDGIWHTVETC